VVRDRRVEVAAAPRDASQAAERGTELSRIVLFAAQLQAFLPERLGPVDVVVDIEGDRAAGRESGRADSQRQRGVVQRRAFESLRPISILRSVQPESPERGPEAKGIFASAVVEQPVERGAEVRQL
jgi:hypothetical protein